jgi:uncharacterized protein GlcG (DUF336 family)
MAGFLSGLARRFAGLGVAAAASLALTGCGGALPGSSSGSSSSSSSSTTYSAPSAEALSVADVQQVLAQAVAQANKDGKPAVISVVDRVGNVLALFRMTGAPITAHITDAPNGVNADAQGLNVPAEASAIAKAITGAYLSSGGNAFSTRTASAIVQAQFPAAASTVGLGSGPLYGVQFSQLPCSDLNTRYGAGGAGALIGPKRSPLGLSADPGGFALYKNGVVVGGIGVEADGTYGFDANVQATNLIVDERVALAGTLGFDAPAAIRADTITVAGTLLIYSDVAASDLALPSGATWASATSLGTLEILTGYTAGAVIAGTAYGSEASGVRAAKSSEFATTGAFVLSDGAGNNRYPARAGSDGADVGAELSASEVQTLLAQAYAVMSQARAQIRNPLNSLAQVSVSVVDTHGVVLGLVRAPDAPLFGVDVSLQKARTAAFFSNSHAAGDLLGNGSASVQGYLTAARGFLGDPTAFTGKYAFTDRAIGNLARPTFPDGSVGRPNGPFSVSAAQFNPFATGLQSALIVGNLAQHLQYVTGGGGSDTPQRCTTTPDVVSGQNRLQNGIQIFPGGVPIYRNGVLVGALGVSGDGIDQDDMISFLGVSNGGTTLGSAAGIGHAASGIRADQIVISLSDGSTARLRYVSCPQSPYVASSSQNVCEGL